MEPELGISVIPCESALLKLVVPDSLVGTDMLPALKVDFPHEFLRCYIIFSLIALSCEFMVIIYPCTKDNTDRSS